MSNSGKKQISNQEILILTLLGGNNGQESKEITFVNKSDLFGTVILTIPHKKPVNSEQLMVNFWPSAEMWIHHDIPSKRFKFDYFEEMLIFIQNFMVDPFVGEKRIELPV